MHDANYDPHADWYAEYVRGPAARYTSDTGHALADLVGPGPGRCLDIGCGTGVQAPVLRALGWTVMGVDLSLGQLRHARIEMPVVAGSAAALPVTVGSIDLGAGTLIHTDVGDWAAVVREARRVLRRSGRFCYVGVHPCFVGPFAERDGDTVRLHPGYRDRSVAFTGPGLGTGIRPRVGVRHRTLTDLLAAVVDAGLELTRVNEFGAGTVPRLLGLVGRRADRGDVVVHPAGGGRCRRA